MPIVNNDVVVDYLTKITDAAFGLFQDDLTDHYPDWKPTTSRKRFMYCQNAASDKPFMARDWHLDTGSKLISGLWYMPHDADEAGGDLLLKNSEDGEVHRVTYSANNLILFPNLTTSWHKVDTRMPSRFNRNFINIVLESNPPSPFTTTREMLTGKMVFERSVTITDILLKKVLDKTVKHLYNYFMVAPGNI